MLHSGWTRSSEALARSASGFQQEATYRAGANAVLTSALLPGLQVALAGAGHPVAAP